MGHERVDDHEVPVFSLGLFELDLLGLVVKLKNEGLPHVFSHAGPTDLEQAGILAVLDPEQGVWHVLVDFCQLHQGV